MAKEKTRQSMTTSDYKELCRATSEEKETLTAVKYNTPLVRKGNVLASVNKLLGANVHPGPV